MNHNMRIFYTVEERNRMGQLRSRYQTENMMTALSDWLLKAHRPLGFPPGVKAGQPPLLLDVIGNCPPIDSLSVELEAYFNWNGERVRSLILRTHASTQQIEPGFDRSTVNIYTSTEYAIAIEKTEEKLRKFCLGKPAATYVAAQFAARDPSHPFWRTFMNMRARSLGL